ncbi:MAG: MGMT family protein [Candidatus Bathyarchaeota archaeon]|jgi:hypothetical protein
MPGRKKTWTEKLHDSKDLPRVEEITEKMSKRWGTGTVVIPSPLEVDGLMRDVQRGEVTTINHIRQALARRHNATIGCPITTGLFANIAAHAAQEQRQQGEDNITPYWRTLKSSGIINPKYPGGREGQKELLEDEGHVVVKLRKNYRVRDFEESLATL